jgi:hypothetical protein
MIVTALPGIPELGLTQAICTNGFGLTLRAIVVEANRFPDAPVAVPVIVIVAGPVLAELVAVRVSTLELLVGLAENAAVTPLGMPDAVRVTPPLNPPMSLTVIESVPPALRAIDSAVGEAVSLKLPPATIVIGIVVDAVRLPEVPVTVMVAMPIADPALALSVMILPLVVGLVPNAADIPAGNPDAARLTRPVNPAKSVITMLSVALPPGESVTLDGEGASVKPGAPVTVMVNVAVVLQPPELV